jgi:hypothetical protein
MPINFPDSPTTGDTHTSGDKTWTYDGTAWNLVVGGVPTVVDTLTINQDAEVDGILTANHIHGNIAGSVYLHVKNTSGVTIPEGSPVYATGSVGASGGTEIAASDASTAATMPALGITQSELVANAEGHATILGVIESLDTSTYGLNDSLYVAPGGGLTDTRPTALTDLVQKIGRVVRVDGSTGEILVLGAGRTNDVPNNVVAGGLTIDTDTLHVASTSNRVGIGTTSPTELLDVDGVVNIRDHVDFTDTTPDAANRVAILPHGYDVYADNAGAGGNSTRLWIDGPDQGEIVLGPRSGSNTLGNMRLRSDYIALEGNASVTSGGKLSVGTASPTAPFEVADPSPIINLVDNDSLVSQNGLSGGAIIRDSAGSVAGAVGFLSSGNQDFDIGSWTPNGNVDIKAGGGSTRLSIRSNGDAYLSGSLQHSIYAFRAYSTVNPQTYTGATTIVYNNTHYNAGNCYSTSSGAYTAPAAGYYFFTAHFFKYTTYTNSTNTYWGLVSSNGYSTITNHGTAGQDGGQQVSAVIYLGVGDSVTVQITNTGTLTSYHSSLFNSFSGYLLSL